MDIECEIPKYKMEEIKIYDNKGNLIGGEIKGIMVINEKTTFSCLIDKIPESGKIVFVVYKDIIKKKESFKLTDINIP